MRMAEKKCAKDKHSWQVVKKDWKPMGGTLVKCQHCGGHADHIGAICMSAGFAVGELQVHLNEEFSKGVYVTEALRKLWRKHCTG